MKLIHNFKSPNFNERGSNAVKYIVIHYTALNSAHDSIKYLCSKQNKVSSHYLISSSGKIYSLVSEKKRAWHAACRPVQELGAMSPSLIGDLFPSRCLDTADSKAPLRLCETAPNIPFACFKRKDPLFKQKKVGSRCRSLQTAEISAAQPVAILLFLAAQSSKFQSENGKY